MKKIILFLSLSALLWPVFLLSPIALAQDFPADSKVIRLGLSEQKDEYFQNFVLEDILEKLGFEVQMVQEEEISILYAQLSQGQVDLIATFWDPMQRVFVDRSPHPENMVVLGSFVKGVRQGYLIDKKTAEKYQITSVEQVKDPQIAALFDYNQDGKADLLGCIEGWPCDVYVSQELEQFELHNTIELAKGDFQHQISVLLARHKRGQPILYYTWTPLWISDLLKPGIDVVWLDYPTPKYKNQFSYHKNREQNVIKFVAHKDFIKRYPDLKAILEKVSIPIEELNHQNYLLKSGKDYKWQIKSQAKKWVEMNVDFNDASLSQQ